MSLWSAGGQLQGGRAQGTGGDDAAACEERPQALGRQPGRTLLRLQQAIRLQHDTVRAVQGLVSRWVQMGIEGSVRRNVRVQFLAYSNFLL